MTEKSVDIGRNRTITAEIYDDGFIVLEFKKEVKQGRYKNGETDNHEVCYNLTQTEVTEMVDFLLETLEDYKSKFGVEEMVNA